MAGKIVSCKIVVKILDGQRRHWLVVTRVIVTY